MHAGVYIYHKRLTSTPKPPWKFMHKEFASCSKSLAVLLEHTARARGVGCSRSVYT